MTSFEGYQQTEISVRKKYLYLLSDEALSISLVLTDSIKGTGLNLIRQISYISKNIAFI